MKTKANNDKAVVLLQSGGRDSTIACTRLLDQGERVFAVTFLHDSSESIDLPKKRATEVSTAYPFYSWAAIDYTEWEKGMKAHVLEKINEILPRSCLICAMARLSAAVTICNNKGSNRIAVGYAGYQGAWAEQTPLAIELQNKYLQDQGITFLLPTQDIVSKDDVIAELREKGLTENSLENACCVAQEGTQPVDKSLITKVVQLCIEFANSQEPILTIRATVGNNV